MWTLDDQYSYLIAYESSTSDLLLYEIDWVARIYKSKTMGYKDSSWSLMSPGITSAKFFGTTTSDFYFFAGVGVQIDSTSYSEDQGVVFSS